MAVNIEVLNTKRKAGTSKAGKPYNFQVCTSICRFPGGDVEVGEVVLFDEPNDIKPGHYVPEFGVKRSQDGRLEGSIVRLVPVVPLK